MRCSRFYQLALAVVGLIGFAAAANAQVIGNWENGSSDGWIDWNTQSGYSGGATSLPSPPYSFSTTTGVTLGSESLEIDQSGDHQDLAIKLEYNTDINGNSDMADFFANNAIAIDVTYPAQTATSGYQEIYQVALNAPGFGFNSITGSSPVDYVGYGGTTGDYTDTLIIPYGQYLAANDGPIASDAEYAEFIFTTNSDAGHSQFYFDNARLITVPEPASLGLAAVGGLLMLRRRRIA